MTKQLFLLNEVCMLNGGNIGGEQAAQAFFASAEELERAGNERKPVEYIRGESSTSIHLLQVELDDHEVVTGLKMNRLFEPGYGFVGKDDTKTSAEKIAELGKWLPAESWKLPEVIPPFTSDFNKDFVDDPNATYITAIQVGKPITYTKIDD